MREYFRGALGGAILGYAGVRVFDTARNLGRPPSSLEADPVRYGRLRRGLMLAGIARSLAALATLAYEIAPRLDSPSPDREPRLRRVALVTSGLVALSLVELPTDYIEGYLIERRFGLSKQKPRAWLADRAKATAVSTVISVPLLELLAVTMARAPRSWPFVAAVGTLPLLIAANVLAPTLLAPLFNRFEPLDGEVADAALALAARYGAGDAAVFRVDMSRQTEKANAYVTGLFGTKRIVIGDTLLANFPPAETNFVVAHELGHYVHRDVWRGVAVAFALVTMSFGASRWLAERTGGSTQTTAGIARVVFGLSVASTLGGPALAAYSRGRERAADTFAVAATGDPLAGAAAFRRLRDRNLAQDEQPKWMEVLFSTHPSLRSRIARLEALGTVS